MPRFPLPSETTAALSTYAFSAGRRRATAADVPVRWPLHIGDTWRAPLAAARAEAQHQADDPALHRYAPVQGLPVLLDAIVRKVARRSGVTLDRDHIQVTAGVTGGLSVAVDALISPGDEVLLPAPFWPLVRGIVAGRGGVPVQIPFFDRLGTPGFDVEATLEAAVTPRTVAIYVNTPHNPTGAILDDATLAAIARVAARHDLWVLSDEVYEDLWFGDAPPQSAWARPDFIERSVVFHSLSKAYGLAGARVGWIHGPDAAMGAIRAVQTFHTYCAARPMQQGAARALDDGEAWLAEARQLYAEAAAIAADGLGIPRPPGGTFLFLDATPWLPAADAGGDPDDAMADLLDALRAVGVTLTPGGASGAAYSTWLRVCFTTIPPDDLREAIAAVRGVLDAAPSRGPR